MPQARESELRSILETVPEAMIAVDAAGRIHSFSSAAEKLFGYAADEITGQDIRQLLPEYTEAAAGAVCDARLPKTPQSQITTGLDRQGNEMPLELAVSEAIFGHEPVSIAFVRNIREQISTQARLNELRDQLLHASRVSAMGEIGAGLAHELNQPLMATGNFLSAATLRLDLGASSDQVRKLVELAKLEVLRASEIVRRMRAFIAKGELNLRAVLLNEIIADALRLVHSRAHCAPRIHLHYHFTPSAPVILADHIQIQQVLVNVVGNALETFASHGTEKPEIVIRAEERPDGNILISVLDNGPGFPSSIISRPFEPFVHARTNGLGLGLSICRRIVEGHGGTLTLANRPEGGAAIKFTLPAYRHMDLKVAE